MGTEFEGSELRRNNWDQPTTYVKTIVKQASTSFYWSMRRLPKPERESMFAVYAFCREVDDIADSHKGSVERQARLAIWRGELEHLYAGRPRHPISRALILPIDQFNLRKQDFQSIIEGMEIDSVDKLRIKTIDELTQYCDLVASAVGRLSIRVFGLDAEIGDCLAFEQGQALQLTNILRDIAEDSDRNRLYLPQDLLLAYDIESENLIDIINHRNLPEVCHMLSAIVERRFSKAREIIKICDPVKVRPAMMMIEVYAALFKKLKSRGWNNLSTAGKLSSIDKYWLALRYGIF